jgi:hypothetical protein
MSVRLSLCPSVLIEQFRSQWTDFDEIWYLSIYTKSVEKIQLSLISEKNSRGNLHEDLVTAATGILTTANGILTTANGILTTATGISGHFSTTLTEVFPGIFLSCKANAKV